MKENRKILIETLKKLPRYIPDEKVWEKTELYLEKKTASVNLPPLSGL